MSLIDPTAAKRAQMANPGLPTDSKGPVFHEPWQAQAFAMTLALHEKGLFAWPEWAAMLGETIKAAQTAGDPDTGDTYYHHWLVTLERITSEKAVATRAELASHRVAWERAAARTPHGEPIELRPGDFQG